jgi:hypothetical protein
VRLQSRSLDRVEQRLDHVPAGGDENHARALPVDRVDVPERLMLEHGLVQRHRDVLLRLESNGGADLLRVPQRRQVDRPHHDALVGDADTHALAELVLGKQRAQRLRKRIHVDDLTVTDHPRSQRRHRRSLDPTLARARLYGRDITGLDVKSYDFLG